MCRLWRMQWFCVELKVEISKVETRVIILSTQAAPNMTVDRIRPG